MMSTELPVSIIILCAIALNDQGVIVWKGEAQGFLSSKYPCRHRYAGPVLSGEYLLRASELSHPS